MIERGALRVAQVVQDGAGGADRGGTVGQAAAIEREQLEVIAQRAVGVVVAEDPVFEFGAQKRGPARSSPVSSGRSAGNSTSRAPRCSSAPATSAGSSSVTRNSPVETSTCATPERVAVARHRGQVVVLVRAQQVGVGGGAGRDDARDLALDQFLGELGVFHLVADGDAVALLDEARDVAFGRVVRHAAHRDGRALFLVARGERDFELARRGDGVFEEQLVEIAQAEHQQGVGHLLLDAVVLPHQRRGGVSQGRWWRWDESRLEVRDGRPCI